MVKCRENAGAAFLFVPALWIVPYVPKPKYRNGQIFIQAPENCFLSLFVNYLFQDAILLLTSKISLQGKHSIWFPLQKSQWHWHSSLRNFTLYPVCWCSCICEPHPFLTYGRHSCWINNIFCRDFIWDTYLSDCDLEEWAKKMKSICSSKCSYSSFLIMLQNNSNVSLKQ